MENFRNVFLFLFLAVYGVLIEMQLPVDIIASNVVANADSSAQGNLKLNNIAFLGSNGNHHHSLKLLKKIREPFVLILLDAHSDAKPYEREVTCGNWVNFAVKENPNIQKIVVIGVSKGLQFEDASLWNNYDLLKSGELVILPAKKCVSYFKDKELPSAFKGLYSSYEFDSIGKFLGYPGYYITWNDYKTSLFTLHSSRYLSIDLDVLKNVKTSYGSGMLDIADLEEIISNLKKNSNIIGVDVCGTDDKSSAASVERIIKCLKSS